MWNRLLARMVDRAIPPYLADPSQESVAAEAAENGIRQTLRWGLITAVVLLAVIAAMLYRYLPDLPISRGQSEAAKAASQLGAENLKLRQENEDLQKDNASLRQANEDSQKKLDAATKAQEAVQGKVTDLEGQVANLTKQLQAAREAAAPSQVATPKESLQPTKQASKPARARDTLRAAELRSGRGEGGITSPPDTYTCGDGRTVRNPGECKAVGGALSAPPPDTYTCGDGRTVRNPTECKPS